MLDFGAGAIEIYQQLGKSIEAKIIRSQIARSDESVGANYHEPQSASSEADFQQASDSQKRLMETIYWLYWIECVSAKKDPQLVCLPEPLIPEREDLRKILNACNLRTQNIYFST